MALFIHELMIAKFGVDFPEGLAWFRSYRMEPISASINVSKPCRDIM
jgi:hypothetical protein